ncbi:MAG TPA: glucosamine-6-phosphate synthase, partial [Acidimicrobiales bacterium]|nr:glucosamine-6-phosphate synthase [Acidimicrobiales bacterium]
MCGIIAVLRRRSDRVPPTAGELLALLDGAPGELEAASGPDLVEVLDALATRVEGADRLLRGTPGVLALLGDRGLAGAVEDLVGELTSVLEQREAHLDTDSVDTTELERINAAIIRLKDASWAVQRDRLRTAVAVADLAGPNPTRAAVEACTSVQAALSAIDRLEVRGRDSAGLSLLVRGHGLDLDDPTVQSLLGARARDPLFTAGAVRITPEGHLSFAYKAAAEIGELGDNTRVLRAAIRNDALLARTLLADTAEVTVLGHTRWASIGIISQPNAHPMNSDEQG